MVVVVGEIIAKTELDYEAEASWAQIGFDESDAGLDACLKEDPMSKVGRETASRDNTVMIAGEFTTKTELDYEKVVPGVTAQIGFDRSDAVLDACLKEDLMSKAGCERASKDNMVTVIGEFTTKTELGYEKVVRGVASQIGFDASDAQSGMRDSIRGQRGQGRWRDCHQDRAGL